MRRTRMEVLRAAWLAALVGLFIPSCLYAGKPLAEYQVKAAYLLKLASFVRWPAAVTPSATGPLAIGIAGPDPFGELLPTDIPADASGQPAFKIVRLGYQEAAGAPVHLLYLGGDDAGAVARLLDRLAERPVLTLGEGEAFLRLGGMMAFTLENKRVRFLINLARAQKVGLEISSQLLGLARSVIR